MPRRTALDSALLTLIAAVAFFSTFATRPADFSALPALEDGTWRSLNTHTLITARNWWEQGMWRIRANLQLIPVSFETAGDPGSPVRESTYSSYPPTFLFPVHLYQKLRGHSVTMGELGTLSLAAHFAAILGFALATYLLCLTAGRGPALAFGAASALLSAHCVPGLQYFGNCWWPDSVIVPLLALFYAAFAAHWRRPDLPGRARLLFAAVVLGGCTEWSFFLHLLVVIPLTWLSGRRRTTLRLLVLPAAIAVALDVLNFVLNANPEVFFHMLTLRTGLTAETHPLSRTVADLVFALPGTAAAIFFGPWLLAFLSALVSLWLDRRDRPRAATIVLAGVSIGPLLHFLALRQHYQDHTYEWVKLVLPQAFCVLLLPRLFPARAAATLALFLAGGLAYGSHHTYPDIAPAPIAAGPEAEALARWVDEQTAVEDTLLATGLEFDTCLGSGQYPESSRFARAFALSFKTSTHVASYAELPERVRSLFVNRDELLHRAKLKLLVAPKDLPSWEKHLKRFPFVEHAGYRIYSLPPI